MKKKSGKLHILESADMHLDMQLKFPTHLPLFIILKNREIGIASSVLEISTPP